MQIILEYLHLDGWQLASIILVAFIVGMGKAGISGVVMLAVPILASALGGKESTGLMALIFIVGDIFAVKAYRQHCRWNEIIRMLPSSLAGILIGTLVGNLINDRQFKLVIAGLLLLCLILMIIQERLGAKFVVPHNIWFVSMVGIVSGFATIVGNAAGPIFAVYLLAIGLNKNNFLGTTAWFFLIINLIKLPIQIIAWHNITWITLLIVICILPAIYLGIRIGVWIISKLQDKTFRYLIILLTAIATIRLFL